MGLFQGFGRLINRYIEQPLKVESKKHENVKTTSESEEDTNIQEPWYWDPDVDAKKKAEYIKNGDVRSMPLFAVDPKYLDVAEIKRQISVWEVQNKKHPWNDAPAKVKVETKDGVCHLKIEYTLGIIPPGVEEILTNPRNLSVSPSLEKKSTKVLEKDGPRQVTEVEKTLKLKFFRWTIPIPIRLIIDENHQTLTATYKKHNMRCMKVFEGSWKVEPLYVDQERLCKSRSHIDAKEYKKCSHGQGRIASKVKMEHMFQPSSLLNVPPVSWFIHEITLKTIKHLLEDFRKYVSNLNQRFEQPEPTFSTT